MSISPETDSRTKTQKNLHLWTTSPLIEVGSGDCPLDQAPKGVDVLSLTGCKSQSYTTWNTVGRGFIPAILYPPHAQNAGTEPEALDEADLILDPKHADVVALGRIAVRKVYDGKYGFSKSKRVLVRTTQGGARRKRAIDDELASSADKDELPSTSGSERARPPVPTAAQPAPSSSGDTQPPPTAGPAAGNAATNYTVVQDIPVRVATTTSYRQVGEGDPIHSPYSNQLYERLVEPHATGALASMVRAPNIRDAASLVSLAKYVRTINTTSHEVAATTRALTMIHSLDSSAHSADSSRFSMVRGYTETSFNGPHINNNPAQRRLAGGRICAVPLDLAIQISINKLEPGLLPNFPYNRMDVDWTMVPVRQTFLNNSSALAYVISHATSEYYSGTINYYSNGTYLTADHQQMAATLTVIPSGNSCHIPGCKNIMLVLLDCSTGSAPVNVQLGDGQFVIPTVRLPNDAADADLSAMWQAYYTDVNIGRIQRDFLGAYLELANNYSTSTAIGTALSVAAELCHAQDTGLILGVEPDGYPTPAQAAHGAWTHGGYPIGPDNFNLQTNAWPADPASDDARYNLTGYNFRKLTPYHRLSTGRVSGLFRIVNIFGLNVIEVGWGTRAPNVSVNGYKLPTLASAMRLSISTNLISIGHQKYTFTSPAGVAGWLSMNGAALAFSTCVHLTTTNYTLRDWAGFSEANDDTTIDQLVNADIAHCTGDIIIPVKLSVLQTLVPNGAWDNIYEYDLMDPVANPNYALSSPFPVIAFHQWRSKLDLSSGSCDFREQAVRIAPGSLVFGFEAKPDTRDLLVDVSTTPDCGSYLPRVLSRLPGSNWVPVQPAVDEWSYLSNIPLRGVSVGKTFTSLTPTYGNFPIAGSLSEPSRILVTDSRSTMRDPSTQVRTTPIRYPDPPESFLRALTDFIVLPALSGLAGFVSGGPVGAAVGAGLALAKSTAERIPSLGTSEPVAPVIPLPKAEILQRPQTPEIGGAERQDAVLEQN